MPPSNSKGIRWYPTTQQLNDPSALERSFRQLLNQHYALLDAHNSLKTAVEKPASVQTPAIPSGCGPADTMILGLRVAPVDTGSLADGAALKYNKTQGNFKFS